MFPTIQPTPVRAVGRTIPAHALQPPPAPFAEVTTDSENLDRNIDTRARQLFAYYPQQIYVSEVLPTRNILELQAFQDWCRSEYEAQLGVEVVYNHPINHAREITTSLLNFQGLLWKARTVLSSSGIIEEYHYIRRITRPNRPDKPTLEPTYTVVYPWGAHGWNVSRPARAYRRE